MGLDIAITEKWRDTNPTDETAAINFLAQHFDAEVLPSTYVRPDSFKFQRSVVVSRTIRNFRQNGCTGEKPPSVLLGIFVAMGGAHYDDMHALNKRAENRNQIAVGRGGLKKLLLSRSDELDQGSTPVASNIRLPRFIRPIGVFYTGKVLTRVHPQLSEMALYRS